MNPPNKPQHPPNPPNGSGLLYIFFSKSEKQNYIFTMELIGGLGGSGGFSVWLIAGEPREKGALLFLRCSGQVARKQ
jgi:hypothetical protein